MEIKKKNNQGNAEHKSGLGLRGEKKEGLFSSIKKALDSQVFFNSRLEALDYIEKLGKVSTAMLTVTISKKKGFLGTDYDIKFSLIHSKGDGYVYQTKNFYDVELPGKEGMIPDYILRELEDEDSIDIKFNNDDLSALYEERKTKVDEEATFDEIIKLCQKENVAAIKLIDRVFYTRVVCYDANKENVGVVHVGALHSLPRELARKLYPGGTAEYVIDETVID